MNEHGVQRLFVAAERFLARVEQDRRNARMIGELAVNGIRGRVFNRASATHAPSDRVVPTQSDGTVRYEPGAVDAVEVHPLMLLGASEVLRAIDDLSTEDLVTWRAVESSGRRRPAVLAALDRRINGDDA